ncbi:MAG: protein-L-isoaspartate(D-aspartate) O-methyltransferase [Methylobacter sp.]
MKRVKHVIFWLAVIGVILLLFSGMVIAEDDFHRQRYVLVNQIKDELASHGIASPIDERVLDAMRKTPRHEFVPASERPFAYQNRPLPIGYGQTISQPLIVAIMTELLQLKKSDRVLEVGSGSGYQAAVLAELAGSVYTIEIVEPLAKQAASNLKKAGYETVNTRIGDGYYGWADAAPFDGIVVTAVASHIPPPLLKQLKPGGRMVIPVGAPFMTQYLVLVSKNADDKITTRQILPVSFVPLTGQH